MSFGKMKPFAGICVLLTLLLQGCASTAQYDFKKYGPIDKVSIIGFSEKEIYIVAAVDTGTSTNPAGANIKVADDISKAILNKLRPLHSNLQNAISSDLTAHEIDADVVPVQRSTFGLAEYVYSSFYQQHLLENTINIWFYKVRNGIVPTMTVRYKMKSRIVPERWERSVRIDRAASFGDLYLHDGMEDVDFVGSSNIRYPDVQYIQEHPDKVAADLMAMIPSLGKAIAQSMYQKTK